VLKAGASKEPERSGGAEHAWFYRRGARFRMDGNLSFPCSSGTALRRLRRSVRGSALPSGCR
jgi:hypothetical protein